MILLLQAVLPLKVALCSRQHFSWRDAWIPGRQGKCTISVFSNLLSSISAVRQRAKTLVTSIDLKHTTRMGVGLGGGGKVGGWEWNISSAYKRYISSFYQTVIYPSCAFSCRRKSSPLRAESKVNCERMHRPAWWVPCLRHYGFLVKNCTFNSNMAKLVFIKQAHRFDLPSPYPPLITSPSTLPLSAWYYFLLECDVNVVSSKKITEAGKYRLWFLQ